MKLNKHMTSSALKHSVYFIYYFSLQETGKSEIKCFLKMLQFNHTCYQVKARVKDNQNQERIRNLSNHFYVNIFSFFIKMLTHCSTNSKIQFSLHLLILMLGLVTSQIYVSKHSSLKTKHQQFTYCITKHKKTGRNAVYVQNFLTLAFK